jgi:hypothetical protein
MIPYDNRDDPPDRLCVYLFYKDQLLVLHGTKAVGMEDS